MKKTIFIFASVMLFFFWAPLALAEEPYVIENFDSHVTINQDTSLTVEETIDVYFNEPRHGIFRDIPVVYRADSRVINSRLQVLSVNDNYETSRQGDSIQIKIGDADKLITGSKSYKITYKMRKIIQRFDSHDELYWNVAGGAWETEIKKVSAGVTSEFAEVTKTKCYECRAVAENKNSASFVSESVLGNGLDMTIVVALNKNNQLNFAATTSELIFDNWGYLVAILPFFAMLIFWLRQGRDIRYVGDNVYFTPDDKATETTPVFNKREFLPMVYSPIAGLTPSEVGTLVDEKVDIHDVVAEIMELGRLGFLKIEKLDKKWAKDDYLIKKLKGDTSKLREYQKYLYDSLFSFGEVKDLVKLSELKKKFYTKLEKFRDKLYVHTKDAGYFGARPDHIRALWLVVVGVTEGLAFFLLIQYFESTGTFWPFVIFAASAIPSFILAYQMPRRTPKGYALFRQTKGLAFYLSKGKWREEIKEKHLFLDEILPLAISLGVVRELARDMQELGVKPPSYFDAHGAVWAASIGNFSSSASSSFGAGTSGSSWSGGSGFSGGGGGGFGGGGGGSW